MVYPLILSRKFFIAFMINGNKKKGYSGTSYIHPSSKMACSCSRISPSLFLLAILFILQNICFPQQYWLTSTVPAHINFPKIHFCDGLYGWVAADSGIIAHTSDGGDSWEIQNTSITSRLLDIFFTDHQRGWALSWEITPSGFSTLLLSTTDGGSSWITRAMPFDQTLFRSIFFLDSARGWLAGENGALARTVDGGITWDTMTVDPGLFSRFPILNLQFYGDQTGYACGGSFDLAGVVWLTRNGGLTWSSRGVAPEPIQDLWVFDSLNVVGVGGDYEFGASTLRTSDGGQSWEYRLLPVLGVARSVEFRTPREGWAPMGLANRFIYTMDGGELWNDYEITGTAGVYDLCFPDSLHGYAVGGGGFFLKYNCYLLKHPFLLTPLNGAAGIAPEPVLRWNPLAGTETYQLQVASDNSFLSPDIDQDGIDTLCFTASGLTAPQRYYWRVRGIQPTGPSRWSDVWEFTIGPGSGISFTINCIPGSFELMPVYPNPFNSATTVSFSIPAAGRVHLEIFDPRGSLITELTNQSLGAGTYRFRWNPTGIPSGLYLIRLSFYTHHNLFRKTRRVLLLQ